MIHVFIGTKAQYVKTAPVLQELTKRGVEYNLIDSGQHAELSKRYRVLFNLKEPDVLLTNSDKDVASLWHFLKWFIHFFLTIYFRPRYIAQTVFKGQKGYCLVHGDTPTTLLSVLAAKRVGIKVVHLESGLRSYKLFNPFPEEIIRIISMYQSDFLFSPSDWAYNNLKKMRVKGTLVNIKSNTNIDALKFITKKEHSLPESIDELNSYVLVSIHRAETLLKRKMAYKVVEIIVEIAKKHSIVFCLHPPTKKYLKKYNLLKTLSDIENIVLFDLLPYPVFISAIKRASFLITDGGSIQEESYYLNVPCLVLRKCTERMEGIGQNVCISEFNDDIIDEFVTNYKQYKSTDTFESNVSPSEKIINTLLSYD